LLERAPGLPVGVAARDLEVGASVQDDAVGGDLARLGDDEAVSELGGGVGEPKRASVGLFAECLVRLPVVSVVEEMGQPQLERAAVVVDIGGLPWGTYVTRRILDRSFGLPDDRGVSARDQATESRCGSATSSMTRSARSRVIESRRHEPAPTAHRVGTPQGRS
jgi:hypothetical protein